MAFDSELLASAVWNLFNSFSNIAERVGLPHSELANALRRRAAVCKNKFEAELWENIGSENKLGDWIWRKRKQSFDEGDETEILKLSHEISAKVRRTLIEIAKSIPASRGGNPPKLNLVQKWEARRRLKKLSGVGWPKHEAYKQVARKMGVSAHTIRRCCDSRERNRSRKALA